MAQLGRALRSGLRNIVFQSHSHDLIFTVNPTFSWVYGFLFCCAIIRFHDFFTNQDTANNLSAIFSATSRCCFSLVLAYTFSVVCTSLWPTLNVDSVMNHAADTGCLRPCRRTEHFGAGPSHPEPPVTETKYITNCSQ